MLQLCSSWFLLQVGNLMQLEINYIKGNIGPLLHPYFPAAHHLLKVCLAQTITAISIIFAKQSHTRYQWYFSPSNSRKWFLWLYWTQKMIEEPEWNYCVSEWRTGSHVESALQMSSSPQGLFLGQDRITIDWGGPPSSGVIFVPLWICARWVSLL